MVLCPDQYLENGIWNTDFSIFGGGGVGGDRVSQKMCDLEIKLCEYVLSESQSVTKLCITGEVPLEEGEGYNK